LQREGWTVNSKRVFALQRLVQTLFGKLTEPKLTEWTRDQRHSTIHCFTQRGPLLNFTSLIRKLIAIGPAIEVVESIGMRPKSMNAHESVPKIHQEIDEILSAEYGPFFQKNRTEE
jgi:hypothetical protein